MKLIKIAAVALLPLAGMANAQEADTMGMGLSMLGLSAENAFNRLNIDADPSQLTVAQLAQIHGILSGDGSPATQRGRIEAIVAQE